MKQQTKFKQTEVGKIPEDWEVKTIDEIKAEEKGAIISGPFGSNIGSRFFVSSGIPVIRGNNLKEDMTKFVDDGFVFLTEEKAKELNTWAKRQDIIFTAAGSIGQVGIIPNDSKYKEYIISNKQLRLRVNPKKVLPLFVFYWFSSPQMVSYIKQRNTGSTIPLINLSVLRNLLTPIPSITEQHSIAKILSDLDSKIELNNKMNETLEAFGQALFKKWFVDERKKDWEVGKLKDVSNIKMGISPKGETYNEKNEGLPLLNGAADFSGKIIIPNKFTTSPIKICKTGDLVFCIRATIGNITFADKEYCLGRGVAVLEIEKDYREFVYYQLKASLEGMISGAHGSVIRGLSKPDIEELIIVIPDNNLLKVFNKICSLIFEKQRLLDKQNQKLSQIRDSLLPKLMNGEIRVK